jgi:5-methylcytosine-specific restriction endonuclease McrA
MKPDNWKDFTQQLVIDYCNERGARTFTLQEFQTAKETEIVSFSDKNKHPFDKVRQQLQLLRKNGIVSFVDNRGTYTLREPVILKDELSEDSVAFVHRKEPNKQEYVRETFARDRGWVKEAKEKFGCYCLHPNCKNTFTKQDKTPYIEVHHIIPLFEGGEDAVWNLAVVCAHHHKMAHFADAEAQLDLRRLFLKIIEKHL